MGNTKSKKSTTPLRIPNFGQTSLEDEKELSYHLANEDGDIDRNHIFHFLKKCLFQNNFSSPIEDKLTQGGSKVLDVG